MTDEKKAYICPVDPENVGTDIATVDDVSLVKGDPEPKELTEDQAQRLTDAGVKLEQVEGVTDAIDKIRTHEQADEALLAANITVAEGTSVEDKKKALRDAQG
jgi:hypothetical protein